MHEYHKSLRPTQAENGPGVRRKADTCATIYRKIGTLFRGRYYLQPLITLLK